MPPLDAAPEADQDLPPLPPGAKAIEALPPPPAGAKEAELPPLPAGARAVERAPQYTREQPFAMKPAKTQEEVQAQYEGLAEGSVYKTPEGKLYTKPKKAPEAAVDQTTGSPIDYTGLGGEEIKPPSSLGVVARGAVRGAVPAAGGIVGAGAGAELGAVAGAPLGPLGAGAGALLGGIAGAMGLGYLTGEAQEWALRQMPEWAKEFLGQSDQQRAADLQAHDKMAMIGELLPNVLAFSPFGAGRAAVEGGTAAERLMAHPITQRALPAGIMGAQEAATEAVQGEPIDPTKVGISAGAGALMQKATPLGERLLGAGAAPVRAFTGRGETAQPPPASATPAAQTPPPDVGSVIGLPMGEAGVQAMTVTRVTPEGDVVLSDPEGAEHRMAAQDVARLRTEVPTQAAPEAAPSPEAPAPAAASAGEARPETPPAPGEAAFPPDLMPVEHGESRSLEDLERVSAEEQQAAQTGVPAPAAEERIANAEAELAKQAQPVDERAAQQNPNLAAERQQQAAAVPHETPAPPERQPIAIQGEGPVPDLIRQRVAESFRLSEQLGITDEIARLAAEQKTARQVVLALGPKLDRVREIARANGEPERNTAEQFVREVRLGLGVPSMDNMEEFNAWRNSYLGSQRAAAPATPAPAAPEVPPGGFRTAKGSAYQVHDDGTTTRNKSYHPEHGATDQGVQPRSEATFYVSPQDAIKLAEIQSEGAPGRILAPLGDGRWGVKYIEGKDAGKFEARTVVTPTDKPAVGMTPVEIFNGGKTVHFGNDIAEVAPRPPVAPEGVGAPVIPPRAPEPASLPEAPVTRLGAETEQAAPPLRQPEPTSSEAPPLSSETVPPPERPTVETPNAPLVTDEQHTKTGKDIYAVRFPSKPDIEDLGKQARSLGGYWSSFRGGGMQPGWMFKTREGADKFAEWARSQLSGGVSRPPGTEAEPPAEAARRPDMIGTGDVLRTASGRETAPVPKIEATSDRKTVNTLRRVDEWLLSEAKKEAEATGNRFVRRQLDAIKIGNVSPADRDGMNMVLWGDTQPSERNRLGAAAAETAPQTEAENVNPPRAGAPPETAEAEVTRVTEPEAVVANPEAVTPAVERLVEEATAEAETQVKEPEPAPYRSLRGTTDSAFVPSTGAALPVEYAIVDAKNLTTSHHDDLSPNSAYPQALQPRSRERAETEAQLAGILNGDPRDPNATFRPELLGENPDAANGSPIIGPEGYVESGNARSMALKRAYDRGLPQAEQYRNFLAAQGYPVEGIEHPVLVRINRAQMDMPQREQLARDLNVAPQAAMSATDRAMADAQQIPADLLRLYQGGDLFSAGNRSLWKGMLDRIAKPAELPGMTNPEGGLSPAGQTRLRNALLAKAYGDSDLVSALAEDPDSNIKAIGGALTDSAAHWARLRQAVAEGRVPKDYDLTSPLLEAVRLISHARETGRNIAEFMKQKGLFGEGVSPETEGILSWMLGAPDWTRRYSRDKMAAALSEYAEAAGREPGMLGGEKMPPQELVEKARERAQGASRDLFTAPVAEPRRAEAVRTELGENRAEVEGQAAPSAGVAAPEGRTRPSEARTEVTKPTDLFGGQKPVAAPPAEKPPPTSKMIEDAGEKIGGARKDRWARRALTTDDLKGMTGAEEAKYVTKNAVWPQPDYAALIQNGMEPQTAALLKIVRDKLGATPSRDTPDGRRNYVEMLGFVRDAFEGAKTPEDLKTARDKVVHDQLGWPRNHYERPPKEVSEKLFSIFSGRKERLGVDRDDIRKAEAMVRSGWPAEPEEPWLRGIEFRPEPSFRATTGEGFKEGPPRTALYKNGKYVRMFETEDAAREFLKTEHEKRGKDREEGKLPERPHLDNLERTGRDVRQGRDVDSPDFVKDFGFRGVEFGNWVAGDERQKAVNLAYDGLHDLADTLGVDPKVLSLDGQLGLAFGARGTGRAAAHYEPEKMVINLTKLSGAGSLAHEWGHALDHYLGELDRENAYQGAPKGATGWYEQRDYTGRKPPQNLRPELAQAVDGLMSAMFKREKTRAEAVRDQELAIERTQAEIEQQRKRLELSREQAEKYPSQAKSTAKFERDSNAWIAQRERVLELQKKRLADARGDGDVPLSKVDTSYYQQARALSGKSGAQGYWARPTEMFARAFEAYVFDKIKAREQASQYLVQGVEGERYKTPPFKGNPYPVGLERDAINGAFDKLIGTLETREGKSGLPALHEGDAGSARNFRDLREDYAQLTRGIPDPHEAGRHYVLQRGHETGTEHLVVSTGAGETIAAGTSGEPDAIQLRGEGIDAALSNPESELVLHHNHPQNLALSAADISMLSHPGVHSVVAHAHDGALYAARLTPEAALWLHGVSSDLGAGVLRTAYNTADQRLHPILQHAVDQGHLTPEQADLLLTDLVNRSLDAAGVTDYISPHPRELISDGGRNLIADTAQAIAASLNRHGFQGEDLAHRIDRSTRQVPPDEGLAGLPRADGRDAENAGSAGGDRGRETGARPPGAAEARLAEKPPGFGGGSSKPPGGEPPGEFPDPEKRSADYARISHTDNKSWLDRLRDTINRIREGGSLAFRQYWFDQLTALERQEKTVHGGELAPGRLSPTISARFAKNWQATLEVALNHAQVKYDPDTGVVTPIEGSKPLKTIIGQLAPAGRQAVDDFALWAITKRAERLMAEGREHNVPREMIERYRNLDSLYQRPDGGNLFQSVHAELQEWHSRLLDFGEAAGLIGKDSRALWEHDDYVPFYRALEEEGIAAPGSGGRGIVNARSPIRKLEGGEQKINNIYENMVLNASAMVRRSMANIAAQKARTMLLFNTDALVPMSKEARVAYGDPAVQERLRAAGLDPLKLTDDAKRGAAELFGALKRRDPDVISVMDGGKANYYQVKDPYLLQSLTAAGPQTMSGLGTLLTAPARLLRGAVVFDPAFMLAHNLRMAQHGFILTGANPITSMTAALRQAKGLDPVALRLMAAGAMSGKYDLNLPKHVRMELDSPEFKASLLDTPLKAARFIHEFAEKAMHAADIGPRIAVYQKAVREGASEAEGIHAARDLLDFSTHGAGGAAMFLAQTIPFLNARWQGMDRSYRGFVGKDRNGMLMRGALVAAATIALWYQNKDDPEYQRKEDWDRQYAWQFKVGDRWFRLPKPFELGALFGSMPEIMLEYANNGSTRELRHAVGGLFENVFKFNPVPVAIRPIAEAWWNVDTFTNRPIVNEREAAMEPDLQYGPGDSPSVVALTQAYNSVSPAPVSPASVQHLIRGYLAGWGTYITTASDYLGEQSGLLPAQAAPAETPVVSRFLRDPGPEPSNRLMTDFYEMKHQVIAAGHSIKEAEKNQDTAFAAKLLARHPEYAPATEKEFNRVGLALSKLRGNYQHAEMNPNLSRDQKTAARDTYFRQRDQILDQLKPFLRQAEGLSPH